MTDWLQRFFGWVHDDSPHVKLESVFQKIDSVVDASPLEKDKHLIDRVTNNVSRRLVALISQHNMLIHYSLLILTAVVLVVIGSFVSIDSIPYTALPPTREHPLFDPSDNDVEHECEIVRENEDAGWSNTIDEKHALIIPFTSGVTLLSLYFGLKWDKLQTVMKTVLRYLGHYIALISFPANVSVYSYAITSLTRNFSHLLRVDARKLLSRYRVSIVDDNDELHCSSLYDTNFHYVDALTERKIYFEELTPQLKKELRRYLAKPEPSTVDSKRQLGNSYFTTSHILSSVLAGIMTAAYYAFSNNWIITNVISMNLTIWAMSQFKLKNLRSGILILSVLFLYDTFLVFETDVMVTVATSLDLPVKLTLPSHYDQGLDMFQFSLLGLGDIILPGAFITLCYKFDIWKWHLDNADREFHFLNWNYCGKYFFTSILSYILGLATCMFSLHRFQAAQPALLYIVPSMLISVLTVAGMNKELREFWKFDYDTIKLGENILEKDGKTYAQFIEEMSDDELDAEYTAADMLMEDEGDEDDPYDEQDYEHKPKEYVPNDLLELIEDAMISTDEDGDYIPDEDDASGEEEEDVTVLIEVEHP